MLLYAILALGAVVLIAAASSASGAPEGYDASNPAGYFQASVEKALPASTDSPPASSEEQAWIDYYKKKFARVSGGIPPEFPNDYSDLGPEGDLDRVPEVMREEIAYALFAQMDPHTLSLFADEVENEGFPIAANRLREKAVRVVDRVGSPETSPMPESASS